jgi:hypothetical protein
MQSQWYAWLTLVLGILLILPMLGITQLGDITSGLIGWLVPIIIITIAVLGLMKVYGK